MKTMITPLSASFVLASAGLLASASIASESSADTLTLTDLTNLATLNREAINSLDVTYSIRQEAPEEFQINNQRPIYYRHQRYLFDLNHPTRYRIDLKQQLTKISAESTVALAYDGDVHTRLNPMSNAGVIASDPPTRTPKEEDPVLIAALMYPPTLGGLGIDDGSMVSLLRHGELREELGKVDLHDVHIVDAYADGKRYATVWLDADRGVVPLRAVMYDANGEITYEQRIFDVREFMDEHGNRVWLPVSIESVSVLRGFEIVTSTEVDPERTLLNPPVHRERFRIEFPPGGTVYDADRRITFKIPGPN